MVAGPTSTIDRHCPSGTKIAIEQRGADEVRRIRSQADDCELTFPATACRNPAFDVTPFGLVSALVTERGVTEPAGGGSVLGLLA